MTRFAPIRPYLTTDAVTTGDWEIRVAGSLCSPEGPLSGWDYNVPLHASCLVTVDREDVEADCDLDPRAALGLVALWQSRSTMSRGIGQIVRLGSERQVELSFAIPSRRVGGQVVLTRQLVLLANRSGADPLSPTASGSILWTEQPAESTTLLLEDSASRFPTEIRDFTGTVNEGGAWFVELELEDLSISAMSAIRLVMNEKHPLTAVLASERVSDDAKELIQSVLEWDVGRSLINAALDNDDFVDHWGLGSEPDTLLAVLEQLVRRHLFGYDPHTLRSIREQNPSRFETLLQRGFQMLVPRT